MAPEPDSQGKVKTTTMSVGDPRYAKAEAQLAKLLGSQWSLRERGLPYEDVVLERTGRSKGSNFATWSAQWRQHHWNDPNDVLRDVQRALESFRDRNLLALHFDHPGAEPERVMKPHAQVQVRADQAKDHVDRLRKAMQTADPRVIEPPPFYVGDPDEKYDYISPFAPKESPRRLPTPSGTPERWKIEDLLAVVAHLVKYEETPSDREFRRGFMMCMDGREFDKSPNRHPGEYAKGYHTAQVLRERLHLTAYEWEDGGSEGPIV